MARNVLMKGNTMTDEQFMYEFGCEFESDNYEPSNDPENDWRIDWAESKDLWVEIT